MREYEYMLLSRMQRDCEYFLGYGNGSERHLFYPTVKEHIEGMKATWNKLEIKPEWLTMEQINKYEKEMLNYNK